MAIPAAGFTEFLHAHAEAHVDGFFAADDRSLEGLSPDEIEARLKQLQPENWEEAAQALQWLIANVGLTAALADQERSNMENFPMQLHLLIGLKSFLTDQKALERMRANFPEVAKAA